MPRDYSDQRPWWRRPPDQPDVRARERFTKGDRVALTDLGLTQFPRYKGRLATVVGFSRSVGAVRIQWDGQHGASSYHASYVEKV